MNRKILIIFIAACCAFLLTVVNISYSSQMVRLEHFAFVATIIGVIINGLFLWYLIKQVKQGEATLREAKKASDAATESIREAYETRIDERSARIIASINISDLLFMKKDNTSQSWGYEAEEYIYKLPDDEQDRLCFSITGLVLNEGKSTTRLRAQGNVRFIHDDESDDLVHLKWSENFGDLDEHKVLAPGQSVRFLWCDSHSTTEWVHANNNTEAGNQNGSCKIQFRTEDFYHDAFDYIDIEIQGRPLQPIGDKSKNRWKLDASQIGVVVYPVQRIYGKESLEKYKSPYPDDPYR
jgi:hypothetical protein